ncbi:hypothetical protein P6166_14010 [Stenotrophomonas sp. HITSZ_GD]|uniref:hypothetical protein n=1 Tax=Stenotrophomonas sp. HITSZ_GD TaxID=3037248 RepID=UPI00240CFBC1|nr:hypothetical protein [Stenotrophomonas sp. HITSZ_GD]MDG2526467.1 hypothetical protein [Stenotrophomonas sp. HITSZ_GD]
MSRKTWSGAGLALLSCALALPACADDAAPPAAAAPRLLYLQVRADVAPDGHIVATADSKLPTVLRGAIEKQVGGWRFHPPMKEGVAVTATTWVRVAACLVPENGNMRLSVGYVANGPMQPDALIFAPPTPPSSLLREGIDTTLQVSYAVQPNGRGKLESVGFEDSVPERFRPWFERSMKQWASEQKFQPERIDGEAVTTHLQTPVRMNLAAQGDRPQARMRREEADRQARRLSEQLNPACVAAAQPYLVDSTVALDSPVSFVGAGGG